MKTEDPFILASQASQVFYCNDLSNKGWVVATKVQSRDAYDTSLPTNDEAASKLNEVQPNTENVDDTYQEMESFTPQFLGYQSNEFNDEVNLRRDDMEKIVVDVPNLGKKRKRVTKT